MRQKSTRFLLFIFIALAQLGAAQILNPTAGYKAGDFVLDSFDLIDANNNPVKFKIPADCHLIVFRYSWHDIGRGVDTKDSIAELERRIKTILNERAFECTKLIVISYDRGKDVAAWQEHIKGNAPFNSGSGYPVEYYNTNGNNPVELRLKKLLSKTNIFSPNGRILRYASYISRFDYPAKSRLMTVFKGKLIGDMDGVNGPLKNAQVSLSSKTEKDTIASALTNEHGEFELKFPGNEADYLMLVKPQYEKTENITLTTPDGREISRLKKTEKGFEYQLLKQEIILLSEMKEEDVTLKLESFITSDKAQLVTAENIYYRSASSEITEGSFPELNKIVKQMNDHKDIKLTIVSHTDAVGSENDNLLLSEKRAQAVADYLVSKGIAPERLKTNGMGEKLIRNRCKNGVQCEDKEHEYNRRTEFIFSKQ